jgi:hypothetical protein
MKRISPMLKRPCSKASRGIMGEMRDKTQKTYFLKNITIFFVSLENSCNFAAETNKI